MNKRSEMAEQIEEQLTPKEQRALEQSIAESLAPTHEPQIQFVEDLEKDLILEAERQHAKQRLLQTLGIVGGGVLTITAGIVGFVLLRRQHADRASEVEDVEFKENATRESVPVPAG